MPRIGQQVAIAMLAAQILPAAWAGGASVPAVRERSYWVHASLGDFTQKGYFGPDFAATPPPSSQEVARAAGLLTGAYGANRLYLIYHKELPVADIRRVFGWWRAVCPRTVELVPALVLRMYDPARTPVFTPGEARDLGAFLHEAIPGGRLAVYDVYAKRDQGESLPELAALFPRGLYRVGLQPGEELAAPFAGAVQDTWSGFCHGARNGEDWEQPGFGAETLRRWVIARNAGDRPVAWNLVVVAWDYGATPRGGYPGYDDAAKNMPLPAGRNRAGAGLIAAAAAPDRLAGFSSDLYILNENSRHPAHDGPARAFYRTLREGRVYEGYYAVPFREITEIYREQATAPGK